MVFTVQSSSFLPLYCANPRMGHLLNTSLIATTLSIRHRLCHPSTIIGPTRGTPVQSRVREFFIASPSSIGGEVNFLLIGSGSKTDDCASMAPCSSPSHSAASASDSGAQFVAACSTYPLSRKRKELVCKAKRKRTEPRQFIADLCSLLSPSDAAVPPKSPLICLLGVGTFFVIRQVLVRRELDLSAKELQEQVRSGDASATELFELGAVMLRRKFYPAANKYLLQAIEQWDGDDQDLAQVYNALGVSYVRDGKVDKGIAQFESAVKLQPGYVTAWNNLGDSYEKKKELKSALKAFEEVLLFEPNNKVARPRRDALKDKVQMYKGVAVKSNSS